MNCQQRFHAIMNFEKPDRMYKAEWAPWWDKTIDRWLGEGLSMPRDPEVGDYYGLVKQFGLDMMLQAWIGFGSEGLEPFRKEGQPLVSSMEDYERVRPFLYPAPETLCPPERLDRFAKIQARGDAVVWITLNGFFWGPRVLLGIEPHLYAFYDEPELMHAINEDICEHNIRITRYVQQHVIPDFMTFAEDMSYNNGPMLSEEMFDEFLLPCYLRCIPPLKEKGTRIFIDSDGDITKALPWFARAGIEGILPLERQAGVDLLKLRETYPKFLFLGHYDKMVMPKGEEAMRAEFERLLPVMRQGGFIPSVDHQTPPGVSLENYKIYVKLLHEYAEKL